MAMTIERTYLTSDEASKVALADVISSGNPNVGETINSGRAIFVGLETQVSAEDDKIIEQLRYITKLCLGESDETADYERVCVIEETEEMTVERLGTKEDVEDKMMSQLAHMRYTRENIVGLMADFDAANKMYAGFAVDCSKKYGVYVVPWLEQTKKLLGLQIKSYTEKDLYLKLLKNGQKTSGNLVTGANGLLFSVSKPHKAIWTKKSGKIIIADTVSESMETCMQIAGKELADYLGTLELPKFSEELKKHVLGEMTSDLSKMDETRRTQTLTFRAEIAYLQLSIQIWSSLSNWKKWEISRIRAAHPGEDCDREIRAIKAAASPGFKALGKDIRRGIHTLSKSLTGDTFKRVAAAALGASFMDVNNKWVADEASAKSFANTALAEEVNLFMYRNMKKKGYQVAEEVVEKLDYVEGVEKDLEIDFTDGTAVIEDADGEDVGVAEAADSHVNGKWTVFENEKGKLMIKKSIEEVLVDQIPTGDEGHRVFITVSNDRNDYTGDFLKKAQAKGTRISLVSYANRGNLKIGQAIVSNGKVVGQYRIPYMNPKVYGVKVFEAAVDAVGNVEGTVERVYTYYSSEEKHYITICVLKDVRRISGYGRTPDHVPDGRLSSKKQILTDTEVLKDMPKLSM